MSSILKALRKLEEQQAACTAGTGSASRTAAAAPVRRSPAWLAPTVVMAIVAGTVAGTVVVMNSLFPHGQSATPPSSPRPQERTQAAGPLPQTLAVPAESGSSPAVVSTAAEEPMSASLGAGRSSAPPTTRPAAPAFPLPRQVQPSAAPGLQEYGTSPSPIPQAQSTSPPVATVDRALARPPASPAPPALTVSGIAWQKGGGDRFAMVNGSPVGEGATVAGAKVLEILPDRVRFSRDGSTFEVAIGPIPLTR
jgi:general secretion pathway protein B